MNDNQQQNQPPTVTNQPTPKVNESRSKSPYFYALLMFLVGAGITYLLITFFPSNKATTLQEQQVEKKAELTLPAEAVDLKTCVDKKGNLYANPNAIPEGPIFLVNNDTVIGLEYVIDQAAFEKGKLYEELAALKIQVDHMQVASLSANYNGKKGSYYTVNLYTIDKETQNTIICPAQPTIPDASPSAMINTVTEISPVIDQEITAAPSLPAAPLSSPTP